ncbi:SWIM zinc finger domain-containing protein [[Clostridium] symbiosum]|uniref:SWIM zinc finger family protein n=1 Tax=Clostridium symbiosum TaxID=1512 RepID=UPI001D07362F|nr:SWIM zinc finger domain-containing protein [[Clostridium] symbiosum]MCB6932154.1 SWIM zinc finger domain-containing protein [[Clostridium] symbiosum]
MLLTIFTEANGNGAKPYIVYINKQHPRKSTCNCPFVNGRRVICKHMLALLFTIAPETVQNFLKEVEKYEAEENKRRQLHYVGMKAYVKSLSKSEHQEQLLIAEFQPERSRLWNTLRISAKIKIGSKA